MMHHVFFWLKNPSSEADLQQLIKGIRSLEQTGKAKMLKVGVPAATPSREVIDASYDVSLLLFFDSLQDHDAYQEHPVHLSFVKEYSHLWQQVKVYDIEDV